MSKLNIKKTANPAAPTMNAPFGKALSANGNLQAIKGPQQILFETLVSTLYGNDSYYESSNDKVKRMVAMMHWLFIMMALHLSISSMVVCLMTSTLSKHVVTNSLILIQRR